jgi:DNA repair protein RecO (recombination protein O)
VSRSAGAPWQDKLLRLPAFLAEPDAEATAEDIADGFMLTGHFLTAHVLYPRGIALAPERERFIAAVLRKGAAPAA